MTATTRGCVTCGKPITITARNPNRRYCTGRCRVADWHHRNQAHAGPNAVAVPNAVPNAVAVANDVPRPANAAPGAGSLTHCPRCQTPLTVLTWLLPPAAAQVTTPASHG